MRSTRHFAAILGAAMLFVAACSSHKILMPPRIDLRAFGAIGMLDFSPRQAGELNVQASREFLAAIQSAQPGVPILELGDRDLVLASLGRGALDADALRAIGERHYVDVVVVGELEARQIKPSFRVGAAAESFSACAQLDGALTVRMYDTRSGATLWTTRAHGREQLASVDVAGGDLFGIGATDPESVEARLVRGLVQQATYDFWPYWVKQ